MSIEQNEAFKPQELDAEKRNEVTNIYRDNLTKTLHDKDNLISDRTINDFFRPEFELVESQIPEEWEKLSQEERKRWIYDTATKYSRSAYDRIKSDQYRISASSFKNIGEQAGIEIGTSADQDSIREINKAGATLLLLREMIAKSDQKQKQIPFPLLDRHPRLPMPTAHPHYLNQGFDSKFLYRVLGINKETPDVQKEGESRMISTFNTSILGLRLIHQQNDMEDEAHAYEIAYFEYGPSVNQPE